MVGHAWIVENGYAMIAKIRQNVIDVEEEAMAPIVKLKLMMKPTMTLMMPMMMMLMMMMPMMMQMMIENGNAMIAKMHHLEHVKHAEEEALTVMMMMTLAMKPTMTLMMSKMPMTMMLVPNDSFKRLCCCMA